MKIAIGADHKGYELKKKLIEHFGQDDGQDGHYQWLDVGADSDQRTDYPIFAKKVCDAITSGQAQLGVLICGSGIGMSIAANRVKHIYAALCWNELVASAARQDDGANVLVLPANYVSFEQSIAIFNAWVNTKFKGGRYKDRLDMVDV